MEEWELSMVGWIFTIGGLLGYFTMLVHSLWLNDNRKTIFIFAGGFIAAYMLEYVLIYGLDQYYYQNLPLTIIDIPVVIPAGWIVSFYGLHNISKDITTDNRKAVLITALIAMFFGFGIETLANIVDFWIFNFEQTSVFGIAINVILAWGLSTALFSTGLHLYEKHYKNRYSYLIIIAVTIANIMIGVILSVF